MDASELLDLAWQVSDGSPVDWAGAEAAAPREARPLVRNLRLVATLAEVHRTEPAADPAADELRALTEKLDAALRESEMPSRWGVLEIRERLGQGGFGQVFRAWDPRLQREVALKLLKPSSHDDIEARVLHEGRVLARVRHPHVVAVHGADTHDGRVGLWMELVEGRSLATLVEQSGRLGAREAALIGIDLCRALAAVHGAGVIHRDVKAHNVLREEGGRIVLMDFGAGRAAAADGDGVSGTPLYLAPESLEGARQTAASDLYSLGVLLYYLVTVDYPVRGSSLAELVERHRRGESRLLRDRRPDLPEGFVQIVERALARDPGVRFATAGQMEQALQATLAGMAAPVQTVATSRRWPRPVRVGAIAVPVLVAAALWLAGRPDRPAADSPYTIEATFFRYADGTRVSLTTGDRLRLGDEVSLEIEASRDVWLYVIDEDDAGRAFALFPHPELSIRNPLPGGVRHRLPGNLPGRPATAWIVDSAGGRERMLLVASPERWVEFEAELNALPRPQRGELARSIPEASRRRLRGLGLLGTASDAEQDATGSTGRLFEMAQRLGESRQEIRGAWVRQIELLNPEP